jgi:hypothetical protein
MQSLPITQHDPTEQVPTPFHARRETHSVSEILCSSEQQIMNKVKNSATEVPYTITRTLTLTLTHTALNVNSVLVIIYLVS